LVTLVSRICMKATTMTVRVMAHFRAGEIGGASGAGGVMRGSRRCDRICAGSRQREGQEGAPLRTGAEYREALHDGRRVWENLDKLKDAYRQWHESKGGSIDVWLDLMADDVNVRSLADGGPGAEFTSQIRSKAEFKRYFDGLLGDWEMLNYKTGDFIADGDWIAMRGSTAWRNRATGRTVDTPKADFWKFKNGKIVEFHEFYDTAALFAAAAR
jgi:uncharacterized protein